MNWDEIEHGGAGEVLTPETAPDVLYHGTNPIAAALIMKQGIEATEPVDDDDLGAVVCTTSCPDIGQMFAIEFARANSDFDVGFVFSIDAKQVVQHAETVPYQAETASFDELEFRVMGDIPRSMITGFKVVGNSSLLRKQSFIEQMWWDMPPHLKQEFRGDRAMFEMAIKALLDAAAR